MDMRTLSQVLEDLGIESCDHNWSGRGEHLTVLARGPSFLITGFETGKMTVEVDADFPDGETPTSLHIKAINARKSLEGFILATEALQKAFR